MEEREKEKRKEEEEALSYSKVKSAQFTSQKISGLEVRARESYLGLLEETLRSNFDQYCKTTLGGAASGKTMSTRDILQCAIEEEYKIFSSNRVVTTYRRGMAFLMAEIKKDTDGWRLHRSIEVYDEKDTNAEAEEEERQQPDALADAKPGTCRGQIQIRPGGFQTALEMCKKKKEKEEEKRGKGQTDIMSYFSQKASKEEKPEKRPKTSEVTKRRWDSLGLTSDEDDDQETASSAPNLNFYCDTLAHHSLSPSTSSSSPELPPSKGIEETLKEKLEEAPPPNDSSNHVVQNGYEMSPSVLPEEMQSSPAEASNSEDEKVSRIQEEIKKVQQQMAEGNDHITYELKARKKEEERERRKKKHNKESKHQRDPPEERETTTKEPFQRPQEEPTAQGRQDEQGHLRR